MTNTKMVIPDYKLQQAAIEVLEWLQADNYPIKPETLDIIIKLAKGDPMPSTKGNK